MKTFRQFVEALSSHGGFMMPHGEENFFKHGFSEKDIKYVTGMYINILSGAIRKRKGDWKSCILLLFQPTKCGLSPQCYYW